MISKWRSQVLKAIANGSVRVLRDATVSVYDAGTEDLATIYADADETAKANPFSAGDTGDVEFWAADGLYDVVIDSAELGETRLDGELIGVADEAVGEAKIEDGAVTTDKLAAAAVTRPKLVSGLSRMLEPVYGGYNLQAGLQRWRRSLGMVQKTSAGVGKGGVDVVVIGDSIAEGGVATSYLHDSWVHLLKVQLQEWLNPSGVEGGYGFRPFVAGVGSASWPGGQDANGTLAVHESKFSRGGTGSSGASAKSLNTNTATSGSPNHRAYVSFDPANSKGGITHVELVSAKGGAAGNTVYDITPNQSPLAYVTQGSAGITGTIAQNGTPTVYGTHWGKLPPSPLDPADQHTVQLAYATGTLAYWNGLIGYNGDWDCGVRVHNLAAWGSVISHYNTADNLVANIDNWGTGALNTGATNARLFIFDFITNDVGTSASPATALATFKSTYGVLIDRALALTSKPSVLLVIPPCRSNANSLANWPAFVTAIYELADERSHVAVLDLFKIADESAYSATVTDLDWDAADGTHYSDTFQKAVAEYVFNCLRA